MSLVYQPGSGGLGGNFRLGNPDNFFGDISADATDSSSAIQPASDLATAESTRDTYFTANPAILATYTPGEHYVLLYYTSGSTDVVQAYLRTATGWEVLGQMITVRGQPGPPGVGSPGPKGDKGDRGDTGADGEGVPTGGTDGQVLKKTGSGDFQTAWEDEVTQFAVQKEGTELSNVINTINFTGGVTVSVDQGVATVNISTPPPTHDADTLEYGKNTSAALPVSPLEATDSVTENVFSADFPSLVVGDYWVFRLPANTTLVSIINPSLPGIDQQGSWTQSGVDPRLWSIGPAVRSSAETTLEITVTGS